MPRLAVITASEVPADGEGLPPMQRARIQQNRELPSSDVVIELKNHAERLNSKRTLVLVPLSVFCFDNVQQSQPG